jgi:hypothetical protein
LTHLRERHDATGPSPTPRNFLRTTASGKNILDVTTYGGFHSHGGTPGAGWFCHGKSETHMNDWTPPYEELKPKKNEPLISKRITCPATIWEDTLHVQC